jgi:hypothetical protein
MSDERDLWKDLQQDVVKLEAALKQAKQCEQEVWAEIMKWSVDNISNALRIRAGGSALMPWPGHVATPAKPPRLAEFCLSVFLDKAKSDALLGDLNERFVRDCERFDVDRARRIYLGRALRSLWPLLKRAVARGIKWVAFVEGVRRLF